MTSVILRSERKSTMFLKRTTSEQKILHSPHAIAFRHSYARGQHALVLVQQNYNTDEMFE